jgi:hypothetical protein
MSSEKNRPYTDEEEIKNSREIAESIFGIRFDKIIRSGSEYNVLAIKSENVLFSQRLDSRTFFIQDKRYDFNRELGFVTDDKLLLDKCHTILAKLDISESEIRKEKIVKEKTQEVEIDKNSDTLKEYEVREGQNFAKLYRQIDGHPVWSSNMMLSLTKEGSIGFMQLHWPEVPSSTIKETHRLDYKIKHGFILPEEQNSPVEKVEAGIIHSPAMGFFMDIYPTIRVIFRASQAGGKKKVLYLDRHGKKVPTPRQIEMRFDDKSQRTSRENRK